MNDRYNERWWGETVCDPWISDWEMVYLSTMASVLRANITNRVMNWFVSSVLIFQAVLSYGWLTL